MLLLMRTDIAQTYESPCRTVDRNFRSRLVITLGDAKIVGEICLRQGINAVCSTNILHLNAIAFAQA